MNRDRGVDQEKQQSSESAVHYDELNQLPPAQFRRWCGVDRHTFHAMVEVLRPSLERQGKRGGQNRLSVENQLVLTFQYWREYRTQFHIALDFGVSEATVCRTIVTITSHHYPQKFPHLNVFRSILSHLNAAFPKTGGALKPLL